MAPLRASDSSADEPTALSAAEQAELRQLTETALRKRGLLKGKVYLTRMELFLDATGKTTFRNALVQHYCYEGDLTFVTAVNLDRKRVLDIETRPHFPTSLAPEELKRAEELARANPQVKRALAREKEPVGVDALVIYTTVPEAPTYHHRVVRLAFRRGRTYLLYAPLADVDLTAETVRVERSDKAHK
jgi:hypothetical protein